MIKFLYALFRLHYEEPVCKTCEILKKELEQYKDKHCETCEILKTDLEYERHEKREILSRTFLKEEEHKQDLDLEKDYKPVLPRHTPWSIRQAILERESREKAKAMAEMAKIEEEAKKKYPVTTVEKLEEELEIAKDVSSNSGGVTFSEVKEVSEKDFEQVNG
jgi:hypothetical protein